MDGSFRIEQFRGIADLVNKNAKGVPKTGKTCRGRFYHLKSWYGVLNELEEAGFGWDEDARMVKAEWDMWERYIAVGLHPNGTRAIGQETKGTGQAIEL